MNQHLLKTLVDDAVIAFLIFDDQTGSCTYLNKKAQEIFEHPDEGRTLKIEKILPLEPRGDFKPLSKPMLEVDGLHQEVLLKRSSNLVFVASTNIKKMVLDGRSLTILMVQDISLQKKLQRELQAKQNEIKAAFEELLKQNQQLKHLDLAKNKFIALTSHELRTPLSAMVASAEILHLKLYDGPEQLNDFVNIIYEQGQHLVHLVNDILDFTKIQAQRMDFYIEQKEVLSLVKTVADSYSGMAETQNIQMTLQSKAQDGICYFDEIRLRQVLSNMINNAIKYNRPGGRLDIFVVDDQDVIKISVHDTGQGIAADKLESVFNEFETLGQVATHHNGTGLGMPISRRLMEGMGGQLKVESKVGYGSHFWVEIPKYKVLHEDLYRSRPHLSELEVA